MIEQLHFTWAENGLQGRGMFQVTAVSAGLQDLSGELALLARRLCRWSGGASQDAVSFGWIDARGHRFVFRRVSAGRTGDGRPGNFAAHVLVAPDGMITLADLLQRSCDGTLWWNGEREADRMLPRLGLQPLCPPFRAGRGASSGAGEAGDEVFEAVAQLLARGAAGRIDGTWQAVLAAAARTSTVLPAPFAALPSFSTFEDGESAGWFQLVGVGPRHHPGEQVPAPVRAAASLIVSGNAADTRRARAAADATEHAGPAPWREFIVLAAAFRALMDEGPVDCAGLLPALGHSGTASEVMKIRRGRDVIADAVIAGRGDVATTLAASAPGISGDLLRSLGIDLAERGTADWGALARVAAPLGRHVLDGLAEVALRSPDADGRGWPGALLQACMRSPALTEAVVPRLANSVAQSGSLHSVLTDSDIYPDHRAQVALSALTAGTLSPAYLAGLTSTHQKLMNPTLLRLAQSGRAGGVLEALPPADAAYAVAEIACDLSEPLLLAACHPLWPRLGLSVALELVISLNCMRWNQHAADWYAVADQVVRDSVHAELDDMHGSPDPRRFLRACSGSPEGQAWRQLLAAICRAHELPDHDNLCRVAGSLRVPALATDVTARAYAVQVILPVVYRGEVALVLPLLLGTVEAWGLKSAIAAAERMVAEHGVNSMTLEVLEVVARSENANRGVIDACGRLARPLDGRSWKILRERLDDASPETRRRLSAINRRAMYRSVFTT